MLAGGVGGELRRSAVGFTIFGRIDTNGAESIRLVIMIGDRCVLSVCGRIGDAFEDVSAESRVTSGVASP